MTNLKVLAPDMALCPRRWSAIMDERDATPNTAISQRGIPPVLPGCRFVVGVGARRLAAAADRADRPAEPLRSDQPAHPRDAVRLRDGGDRRLPADRDSQLDWPSPRRRHEAARARAVVAAGPLRLSCLGADAWLAGVADRCRVSGGARRGRRA